MSDFASELLIREDDYAAQMAAVVYPYLAQRKEEIYIKRHDGLRLYCAVYTADDAAGTVLISNGFTETADKYTEMIYYFLRSHLNVLAWDQTGHGRSSRLVDDPSLVHIDQYQRYVKDVVRVARIGQYFFPDLPAYLFGHSMGGGIAAAAVCMSRKHFNRDIFTKVVLSSPMIRPQTGPLPWQVARMTAGTLCGSRREKDYLPGQSPYGEKELFENSAATSRARFDEYNEIRHENPLFRMSAGSNGWLFEAAKMEYYLLNRGYLIYQAPTLLFQAGLDTYVDPMAQNDFAAKVNTVNAGTIDLIRVPEAKHEIYKSTDDVLVPYMERILEFFR